MNKHTAGTLRHSKTHRTQALRAWFRRRKWSDAEKAMLSSRKVPPVSFNMIRTPTALTTARPDV